MAYKHEWVTNDTINVKESVKEPIPIIHGIELTQIDKFEFKRGKTLPRTQKSLLIDFINYLNGLR